MADSDGLAGAAQRLVLVCNGDDSRLTLETTAEVEPLKRPAEDLPLVFQCGQCRRVLGDSTAWVQSDLKEHSVLLRAVSSFVVKDEERKVSRTPQDNCCLIEALFCAGCSTCIGKIYKSTPRHLDFKRDLYCLDISAIESYVLGSTTLQVIAEADEPITLEKRSELEAELDKAKVVLKVLQDQISTLQAKMS